MNDSMHACLARTNEECKKIIGENFTRSQQSANMHIGTVIHSEISQKMLWLLLTLSPLCTAHNKTSEEDETDGSFALRITLAVLVLCTM